MTRDLGTALREVSRFHEAITACQVDAHLASADLRSTYFASTDLTGANLAEAILTARTSPARS